MSHFYRHDGTPCESNEPNALPSVTTVLKQIQSPALLRYFTKEAILAAQITPRALGETDHEYTQRAFKVSQAKSDSAQAFGKKIHENLRRFNTDPKAKLDFDCEPWVRQWQLWAGQNLLRVLECEKGYAVSALGFGGTLDVVATHRELGHILLDFKTQKIKTHAQFWPPFCWQLAAYSALYASVHQLSEHPRIVCTIIDSNSHNTPIAVKLWSKQEQEAGLAIAVACGRIWRCQRIFQ